MGSSSIGMVTVLILVALVAVVLLIFLPRLLVTRRTAFKDPVCGRCRYTVAPNPNGLTVCPECGADYLVAGILAPGTRLPTRLPAVIAPLLWIALCAVGSVLTYRAIYPTVLKTITTTAINETSTLPNTGGVISHLPVTYNTIVDTAASNPLAAGIVLDSSMDVQLRPARGSPLSLTIDPRTRLVTQSDVPGLGKGVRWGPAAAKSVIAALKAQTGDPSIESDDETELVSAVDQRLDNAGKPIQTFGTITAFTSFSSSAFSSGGRNRLSTTNSPRVNLLSGSTSLRTSSGTSQDVFIGSLRGKWWLVGFVGGGGLLAALLGLLWIGFVNRRAR